MQQSANNRYICTALNQQSAVDVFYSALLILLCCLLYGEYTLILDPQSVSGVSL